MIVATRKPAAALKSILTRLRREYFPRARFTQRGSSVAVADGHRRELASAFQPIVEVGGGGINGHQALLRAADENGQRLPPAALFDGVDDEEALAELDRLARALHAINYFPRMRDRSRLFLPVEARLMAHAAQDHRAYFDGLLSLMDVPTSRVVLVLPRAALDDPVTFVRSALSYSARGYRVLANMTLEDAHADLEHVFMAAPHYVGVDAAGSASPCGYNERWKRLRSVVASLQSRGIQALARRIESGGDARAARDAGFSLLQGMHLAPPAPWASSKEIAA